MGVKRDKKNEKDYNSLLQSEHNLSQSKVPTSEIEKDKVVKK